MKSQSLFGIQGVLRVFRVSADRQMLTQCQNTVTNIGLEVMAKLLGGAQHNPIIGSAQVFAEEAASLFVTTMKIGTAATPPAANPGDTAIGTPVIKTWTTSDLGVYVSYPSSFTVRFESQLLPEEANGSVITEEGLYTGNGLLVARTVPSVPWTKTDAFGLLFQHDLTITRV